MPLGQLLAPSLTLIVLQAVLLVAGLYVLYWTVRKAVAHGIRDARRAEARTPDRAA